LDLDTLLFVIAALAYYKFYPPVNPLKAPSEKCSISPASYNIKHVADCSKFTPGSLAGVAHVILRNTM